MSDSAVRLVVDSSVAVKWYVSEAEAHTAEALDLLGAHRTREAVIAAPSHLLLEVLNALKHRGLAEFELARAADALIGTEIELHPVESLVRAATVLASRHSLTLYDAAFAALALELDAKLVTADRRLAESGACRARLLGA